MSTYRICAGGCFRVGCDVCGTRPCAGTIFGAKVLLLNFPARARRRSSAWGESKVADESVQEECTEEKQRFLIELG